MAYKNEMSQKIETMQFEKDNLITKQNQLILEISKLKDLQQSREYKSEEMTLQINELQKDRNTQTRRKGKNFCPDRKFKNCNLKLNYWRNK